MRSIDRKIADAREHKAQVYRKHIKGHELEHKAYEQQQMQSEWEQSAQIITQEWHVQPSSAVVPSSATMKPCTKKKIYRNSCTHFIENWMWAIWCKRHIPHLVQPIWPSTLCTMGYAMWWMHIWMWRISMSFSIELDFVDNAYKSNSSTAACRLWNGYAACVRISWYCVVGCGRADGGKSLFCRLTAVIPLR